MSYIYTEENRLLVPHKYMYAEYKGIAFLDMYKSDRLSMLRRISMSTCDKIADLSVLDSTIFNAIKSRISLSGDESQKIINRVVFAISPDKIVPDENENVLTTLPLLESFRTTDHIVTENLLIALISKMTSGCFGEDMKAWIDLLVQKFEVTKKIYTGYQPFFKKGVGLADHVDLYWYLAAILCIYYLETDQLKYMSTWLKVMDLLNSLDDDLLFGYFSSDAMMAIVIAEMDSINRLIKNANI